MQRILRYPVNLVLTQHWGRDDPATRLARSSTESECQMPTVWSPEPET